jgi:hypothetical protein
MRKYLVYAQEQTDYPMHVDTVAEFVRARSPKDAASKVRVKLTMQRRADRVDILSVEPAARRRR